MTRSPDAADASQSDISWPDLSWHDGVLVAIRLPDADADAPRIELVADLYPELGAGERQRFLCIGEGLHSLSFTGNIPRLAAHRGAGNINSCHFIDEGDRVHLSVLFFGGALLASATRFFLRREQT